jgi:hypothetical protein
VACGAVVPGGKALSINPVCVLGAAAPVHTPWQHGQALGPSLPHRSTCTTHPFTTLLARPMSAPAAAGAGGGGGGADAAPADADSIYLNEASSNMNTAGTSPGIQVIGAGLGRTGTKSLQAALDLLGYKTYHFPLPAHAESWARFAEGCISAEEAINVVSRDGFTATCDQPCADVYRDQLRLYPNAKVVLTVRESGAVWAASWKVLMNFIEVQERPFSLTYPSFIQWVPFMRAWKRMRNVMGTHLGLPPGELIRGWRSQPDPDAWLAAQYETHNAQVKHHMKDGGSQLLVFNVKDGWAPLCAFLGKEVPAQPFPCVNESADIEFATKVMKSVTYAWLPLLAVSVALARAFLLRR